MPMSIIPIEVSKPNTLKPPPASRVETSQPASFQHTLKATTATTHDASKNPKTSTAKKKSAASSPAPASLSSSVSLLVSPQVAASTAMPKPLVLGVREAEPNSATKVALSPTELGTRTKAASLLSTKTPEKAPVPKADTVSHTAQRLVVMKSQVTGATRALSKPISNSGSRSPTVASLTRFTPLKAGGTAIPVNADETASVASSSDIHSANTQHGTTKSVSHAMPGPSEPTTSLGPVTQSPPFTSRVNVKANTAERAGDISAKTTASPKPPGWTIQSTGASEQQGVKRTSWMIRPPVAEGPPMKLDLTQEGSHLKADLTVSTQSMGIINATPTALPHQAVHLPEGVSTLQFSLMTQGGSTGMGGQSSSQSGSSDSGWGTNYGSSGMSQMGSLDSAGRGSVSDGIDYHA